MHFMTFYIKGEGNGKESGKVCEDRDDHCSKIIFKKKPDGIKQKSPENLKNIFKNLFTWS